MVICASVYGGGLFLLRALPTRHSALDLRDGAAGVIVEPRHGRVAGTIIYLPDRRTAPEELAKSTLRPLAQRGWKVICFEQPAFSVDALNHTREMIGRLSASGLHPAGKWFLAGERQGGMVAMAVAAEEVSWHGAGASAVAVCGTPAASPFSEVSPMAQAALLRCPALLFFAENDIKVPAHHGQRLREAMAASAKAQLVIIPADLDSDGAGWQLWIGAIDEAFRNAS